MCSGQLSLTLTSVPGGLYWGTILQVASSFSNRESGGWTVDYWLIIRNWVRQFSPSEHVITTGQPNNNPFASLQVQHMTQWHLDDSHKGYHHFTWRSKHLPIKVRICRITVRAKPFRINYTISDPRFQILGFKNVVHNFFFNEINTFLK